MKILVGLSGGVDSAVSALLLKEAGHDVSAGFMVNYLSEDESCPTRADMAIAREVAAFLDIPFHTFDFIEEYDRRIVEYIYREYRLGRTPNPDVFCNNLVKFDLFRSEALSYGFDAIATGHYARKSLTNASVVGAELYKGVDPGKDQSYFLSRLSSAQLSGALFPIGHLLKSQVRILAQEAHLPNALRKDSQGLCFIGKVSMQEFLARRLESHPGAIVDTSGTQIGTHQGLWRYTLGQRKGIEIGGIGPFFVVVKDLTANRLVVGHENDPLLYRSTVALSAWQASGDIPRDRICGAAKVRYRHFDQPCEVVIDGSSATAHFETPQRAVAPGQIVVVYEGEKVAGSGIIEG